MIESPPSNVPPCDEQFTGRPIMDWCRDCGHALSVHRRDHVCSVCDAIAVMRAELAT